MLVLGHRFTRCDLNVELHSWGSLHTYGISYVTVCVCVCVCVFSLMASQATFAGLSVPPETLSAVCLQQEAES